MRLFALICFLMMPILGKAQSVNYVVSIDYLTWFDCFENCEPWETWEGNDQKGFFITIDGAETDGHPELKINLQIGGSATNGVDYVFDDSWYETGNPSGVFPEVITIQASADCSFCTYVFPVIHVDDSIVEGNETIEVTILEGDGYVVTGSTRYTATGIIFDNDQDPSDFRINAGLNGSWFDPSVNDQGFMVDVYPEVKVMSVAWFTYELASGGEQADPGAVLGNSSQRWMSAQGQYQGNEAVLDVWNFGGGSFGKKKASRSDGPVGTLRVKFNNCNDGSMTYNLEFIENGKTRVVDGSNNIQRISLDNVELCEALDEALRQAQ